MKLTSADLVITAVNITSLLKEAHKKAAQASQQAKAPNVNVFNPSLVHEEGGGYIAAGRVLLSSRGSVVTVLTRIDAELTRLRGKQVVISTLLPGDSNACDANALPSPPGGCTGTEDMRLRLSGGRLWVTGNEMVEGERKVVMAELHPASFEVIRSGVLCEDFQGDSEKNWGVFRTEGKWNILYQLSPLETFAIAGKNPLERKSERKRQEATILDRVVAAFKDVTGYVVKIQNRTSPVEVRHGLFLCMGGLVMDWQASDPQVNGMLVPGIKGGASQYDADDQKHWSEEYHKLHLCFFFVFKMTAGGEVRIEAITNFFQLPTRESRDELHVFPTTLTLVSTSKGGETNSKQEVVVSYGVGNDRAYVAKIPYPLIELMLQDSEHAQLFQGLNVNPDEPIHVARVARRVLKLDDRPKEYLLRDALA